MCSRINNNFRNGNCNLVTSNYILYDLPDSVDIPTKCIVSSDVIDTVLADLSSDLTTTVLLTPKNEASLALLNNQVLNRLEGEKRLYLSVDRVVCDNKEEEQNYPLEFINSLTPSGLPEHKL